MNIQEIIKTLSDKEKHELFQYLKNENSQIPRIEQVCNDVSKEQVVNCPHCDNSDIYGHGIYKGRKRYKCKNCGKTFNDLTGTAISGIKKVDKFHEYLQLTIESLTIRKAAELLDLNVKTIFDWRHKLLSSLLLVNGQVFSGIVECDDKQLDINEKGRRNLDRDAYKRPSDRKKKRGVSNDKVSIMVATDRKENPTMKIAKIGRVDEESIEKTIGGLVDKKNILCSDSHPSIIAWAGTKKLEHHTFVATRQHVKDKCYHVQHVNSLDSLYERWVSRFNGISTKYLPQYLNWFVFLRKIKGTINPLMDFARVISSNIGTLKTFRGIEDEYLKLIIPQISKT
jgi:transposase-like protein